MALRSSGQSRGMGCVQHSSQCVVCIKTESPARAVLLSMFGVPDTCRQRAETENVCSISFDFCILIK